MLKTGLSVNKSATPLQKCLNPGKQNLQGASPFRRALGKIIKYLPKESTSLIFILNKALESRNVTLKESDMYTETLETRIINRIKRKRGDVFLRSDFKDLGGYDQVGRVLRDLVRKGMLLKVSHGLYTRAVKSPFSENPVPPKGLETLTEALRRVGVEIVETRLEREYNAGLTTQVPTGRVVGVRRRVRRKIGYDGINLSFESAGYRQTPGRDSP